MKEYEGVSVGSVSESDAAIDDAVKDIEELLGSVKTSMFDRDEKPHMISVTTKPPKWLRAVSAAAFIAGSIGIGVLSSCAGDKLFSILVPEDASKMTRIFGKVGSVCAGSILAGKLGDAWKEEIDGLERDATDILKTIEEGKNGK